MTRDGSQGNRKKTYLLTPCSRVLLEKLIGVHLVKKFPAFYLTKSFITAVTSAHHLSLSWARSIHSIHPHPIFWRSILILSSYLRLGLPICLFSPGFLTNTMYKPLLSLICATCPAHLILLDFITRIILGEVYRNLGSSLCSFLHSPVTSSLIGPNTLLNTLLSNILSLGFSLNVSDQVSHPYTIKLKVFFFNFEGLTMNTAGRNVLSHALLVTHLSCFISVPVPCIFYYFVLWPTNVQLFNKLSHSYMFRHYGVILMELVINTLPSYTSISNAAGGNTIYN